jgi:hypothetical protein
MSPLQNVLQPLQNVWGQLVQRRLLPVAVLLVAALAAIPFVLRKDAKPEPVNVPVASSGEAAAALPQPVVQLAQDGDQTKRRRVLGARKNPFEPATAATPPRTDRATAPTATTVSQTSSSPTAGGTTLESPGSAPSIPSVPSSGGTGSAPAVTAPPAGTAPVARPKPSYELYSITVRFGDPSADSLEKRTVSRLKPLPSSKDPILVYLGPSADAKTALFMVDESVDAWGDGTCDPSPADCQTIALREGDTEFFSTKDPQSGSTGTQYELDLVDIHTRKTASASMAQAARAEESSAGRQILNARLAADGPLRYRYDRESGMVRKLSAKAWKAAVARSAQAAMATAGGFAATP